MVSDIVEQLKHVASDNTEILQFDEVLVIDQAAYEIISLRSQLEEARALSNENREWAQRMADDWAEFCKALSLEWGDQQHAVNQIVANFNKAAEEARAEALEEFAELFLFTKWTASVSHCPPPRSKRDNPLKNMSFIRLHGQFDTEDEALSAARSQISSGWANGSIIIHQESAQPHARFEIQSGVSDQIGRRLAAAIRKLKGGIAPKPVPSLGKLFDDLATKQRLIREEFEEFMSDVEDTTEADDTDAIWKRKEKP